MRKKFYPFCFRHSTISPCWLPNSVCFSCLVKDACVKRDDDIEIQTPEEKCYGNVEIKMPKVMHCSTCDRFDKVNHKPIMDVCPMRSGPYICGINGYMTLLDDFVARCGCRYHPYANEDKHD